ncbi:MAG: amidohydrolase family protein [Gammaproteobacteria bacterium]|nr:amidohydrolase family protein [Gammaproteobacteria bacterium]
MKNLGKSLFVLALLMLASNALAQVQTVGLHCGNVFDAASGKLLGERFITVTGKQITAISTQRPETDELVDLATKTCLPGLIDLHVHLSDQLAPDSYLHRFTWSEADYAFNAAANAQKTLLAGFTTVRDLGDNRRVTIALRNAIRSGKASGPRIFAAGNTIASTGGHGDGTNGIPWNDYTTPGPRSGIVNSVADAREAVRQHYKEGSDWIKITATGGVLSLANSGENAQFTAAELDAIVTTAKDYGMRVAAHAHGAEGMLRAVRAGITTVEHGTFMTDAIMQEMKQRGTWYVPTISAGMFVADKAKQDGFFPPMVRDKAARIGPLIADTFSKAYQAGVKIAFGTDTGVSAHGDNARELVYMVDAGMPAAAALQSATVRAAEVLDQQQSLGQIAPGFAADIIAVSGDPLADVSLLSKVEFVMADGQIINKLQSQTGR